MSLDEIKIKAVRAEVFKVFEEAAAQNDYQREHEREKLTLIKSRADTYRDLAPLVANAVERALKVALG